MNILIHIGSLIVQLVLFLLWLKLRNQTMSWINQLRTYQEKLEKELIECQITLRKEQDRFV